MDQKRVNGKQQKGSTGSPSHWIAVIAICTLLPLAGGWLFGPHLQAQDKKGPGTPIGNPFPFPPVPIQIPSTDTTKVQSLPGSGGGGKVGFVTVDPFEIPATAQAPTRVNPFPLIAEKAPEFPPLSADPKKAVEGAKIIAETTSTPFGSTPGPKQGEIQRVQNLNLPKEKFVEPPIVLPVPNLEVAAQKEQPVPVPLPQVVPPGGDKPGVLPQPRPVPVPLPPFKDGQVRMPLLGDSEVTPLGKTPFPTPKVLKEYAQYVNGFIDPNNTLDLIQARARLMMMKETPKRIQVSDDSILSYSVVGNKEITLLGKTPGTTVLNMWFASADDKTKETVLSYLVRVFPDPEAKDRLERVYRALEIEINKNFPDSLVRLKLVGDKVMVTGQAHDIFDATQILKIVVANTPGATKIPSEALANTPRPETPGAKEGATPGQENYISSGSPSVINMLKIGGVQQVMLRVVVAEVNRSAARSIGLNFSLTNNQGVTYLQNLTGGIANQGFGAAAAAANLAGGVTPLGNLPIRLDNGQVALSVNALKRMNYAKSLAEPNLSTLNGQPASFLAGGQFPVPVVTGNTFGGGLQGTTFVPFGVQLQFTPFITDKDRIRLNVNATVSTRDTSTGTNIGNSQVSGLTVRNFSSTVEMRDGQTLAVAGLIQSNSGMDRDQLPFLGDIPFVNRFTGFDRGSAAEQELVILITPELVQPMYHQQLPRLPGSDLFEPSDLEFYLLGRLEGRRMTDFRSPVMTDIHRIRQYNRVEQHYIFGPAGHYNVPLIPK